MIVQMHPVFIVLTNSVNNFTTFVMTLVYFQCVTPVAVLDAKKWFSICFELSLSSADLAAFGRSDLCHIVALLHVIFQILCSCRPLIKIFMCLLWNLHCVLVVVCCWLQT